MVIILVIIYLLTASRNEAVAGGTSSQLSGAVTTGTQLATIFRENEVSEAIADRDISVLEIETEQARRAAREQTLTSAATLQATLAKIEQEAALRDETFQAALAANEVARVTALADLSRARKARYEAQGDSYEAGINAAGAVVEAAVGLGGQITDYFQSAKRTPPIVPIETARLHGRPNTGPPGR